MRLRGFSASKRGAEGNEDRDEGVSVARLTCGVSPVDEEKVDMLGAGAENRTRFFGLVGVFTISGMV